MSCSSFFIFIILFKNVLKNVHAVLICKYEKIYLNFSFSFDFIFFNSFFSFSAQKYKKMQREKKNVFCFFLIKFFLFLFKNFGPVFNFLL